MLVKMMGMEDRVRRWLRSHPKVQTYLSRDEYGKVREVASSMGWSVSELVKRAVLDLAALRDEVYERGYREGYYSAVKEVWDLCDRFGPRFLFEIEEFTVPCFKCGDPVVLSSRNKEFWEREVKPKLVEMFFNYAHKECAESSE
jgi:hypothetical protein